MAEFVQEADDDRSVAATIARALGERIVRGVLAPGERLRQDHVAGEFRASHVPVREAFRRLEAQGLVVAEPRRGVRVAHLDPADVLAVAEMRAALETLALRHALPRFTLRDAEAARQALEVADTGETNDLQTLEAANRSFHAALVAPCGMPRLTACIADLHRASARHLFAVWRDFGWEPRSREEHHAILAAIAADDIERACALLSEHIMASGQALAAALHSR